MTWFKNNDFPSDQFTVVSKFSIDSTVNVLGGISLYGPPNETAAFGDVYSVPSTLYKTFT